MDKGICLDTSICIELIKGNESVRNSVSAYASISVYISPISVFELFLRKSNMNEIENFVKGVEIMPFDEKTARRASELYKEMQKLGRTIDFRDSFIASTAIVNNCVLATLNRKHFECVKGLELLEI